MSEKMSRRDVSKRGLLGLAVMAAGPLASASQGAGSDPVEKELAKPLSEEARKLLKGARAGTAGFHSARLKHKLPDCSEPCTIYVPTPPAEGSK